MERKRLLSFIFLMLTVLKHAQLLQLLMYETENILYLGMSVDSVKQKNLVSTFLHVLVSLLLSPTRTSYYSNKGVFFWLIILFSIFLQSYVKRRLWIKRVVYSKQKNIFFFLKNHQDVEISFLSEILLLSLISFLLFACVWHCTNKWLDTLKCPMPTERI